MRFTKRSRSTPVLHMVQSFILFINAIIKENVQIKTSVDERPFTSNYVTFA